MKYRTHRLILPVVALVLTTLLVPGPILHAQTDLLVWAQVGGVPPTIGLTDVQMVDQDTAWAVGNDLGSGGGSGYVYRLTWTGGRWTVTQDARFTAPLHALHVLDGSNIWAVGDNGLIIHRDDDGWNTVASPIANSSLVTLEMSGNGQEGWAGGSFQLEGQSQQPLLLHYRNGAWRQEATPVRDGEIRALDVTGGSIWAIVSGQVWRFADGQWAAETIPDPCGGYPGCYAWLNELHAIDQNDIWVTGSSRANCSLCSSSPFVLRRTGTWQSTQLPALYEPGDFPYGTTLNAVDFIDHEHGLLVGGQSFGRNAQSFDQPIVLRYTNGGWSRDALPLGSGDLQDVDQHDLTHVLAVGLNGRILSYGYGPSELSTPPTASNGDFADPAFRSLWERSDLPVAVRAPGLQPRTWLWGPQPNTAGYREPYAESPGSMRQVQYFDKSRMEITRPGEARGPGFVTNGLLVVEMISGKIQVGDNLFESRPATYEAIAGDRIEINPQAPTYSNLINVAYPNVCDLCRQVPPQVGQVVTKQFTGSEVRTDASLGHYNVILGAYESQLGHNIPQVFTDFFAQQGLIYENGRYTQGQLIDWIFVMGLPISEPYWTRVKVGGIEKDVLFQAFERRVLTYTPDNAPEWRVEMGNVGQHYLRWRHGR